MALPYRDSFDEAAYLREHPQVRALVRRQELASAYEHMLATCSEEQIARYLVGAPEPTVTVVVPAYNAERWLGHTLTSVRNQSYRAWECLVVDDGSSDGTERIARLYTSRDKRFKVIQHRSNGGQNAARNSGLRSARGRYLAFLDSDDLLMTTSLAARVRAIAEHDDARLAGSYSASQTIDEAREDPPASRPERGMRVVDFITAAGMCPFNANQPMFKTAVLRDLGGFDERMSQAEDWELWMRILRHGYRFVPTGTTEVTYRTHEGSMVRSAPFQHLRASMSLYEAAHAPLPAANTFEGAPYVFRKPWIAYKQQLDMARRVLEFCGMELASGELVPEVVERAARALPDFRGALSPHRNLVDLVELGVRRQRAGQGGDSRAVARRIAEAIERAIDDAERPDADSSAELAPHDFGPRPHEQRDVDVVFLPHKDYHVWSFSLVVDKLDAAGISYVFVDPSVVYRDEGAPGKLAELGLPSISYNQLVLGDYRPRLVVCMNDWDPLVREVVRCCKQLGIATVGVVEGVQDYLDVDTGRVRAPYRTVDYVLLPGEFDARYFPDSSKVRVGGVPRIDDLLREQPRFPDAPLVVINSNFTYNVLTEHRDEWVRQAVEACERAGYDYRISRHPADVGDYGRYKVADESMYDLIRRGSVFVSRFGSGILESLAMGKPAIYFNPHGERIDKFTEPHGAFPISTSLDELTRDLRRTVEEPRQFLDHADAYLRLHCGTSWSSDRPAAQLLGEQLLDIYHAVESAPRERASRLRHVLIASNQRLLGPLTMGRVLDERWRTGPGRYLLRAVERFDLFPYQLHAAQLERKYRKLVRDPHRFFADSKLRPVRLLKRFF